jgi:hypothetical protein
MPRKKTTDHAGLIAELTRLRTALRAIDAALVPAINLSPAGRWEIIQQARTLAQQALSGPTIHRCERCGFLAEFDADVEKVHRRCIIAECAGRMLPWSVADGDEPT